MNRFHERQIVFANDESFGITFTRWKHNSWSRRWNDVQRIDAMQIAPGNPGLVVWATNGSQAFISHNSENWEELEKAIRRRYPDFDWQAFAQAESEQRDLSRRFTCWRRPE